ncbi:hypothetical protein AMJ57_02885 [Parcubacteria bacterium SG8_24]|nr:MAG: hypothetical protein AMJ57_02885 [Parcubacteria bacterium SG8_24]
MATGAVEAPTAELAMDTLRDRGLSVISLEEAARPGLLELEIPFLSGIPIKDIVVFSRQFSVLMGSKVPIVKALQTVSRQTNNPRLQRMLVDIADEVESGTSLSVAMSKYPKAFSGFFVNMVRSGETTGRLEDVMNYLADQMERDFDLNSKIKGAMIYPIFVIVGLVVVGFIMMAFVVPKLTDVLTESGAELPITTKILIAVSTFFKAYAIQIIIAAVLAVIALQWWIRTPGGRPIWDKLILKIPVFGPLLQRIYVIRFTRSMSTMVSGGIDIPSSLEISADVVGNAFYRGQILETKREVSDGHSITTVFEREGSMPTMVSQMMSVGEETGRLSEVLDKLTDFYSREVENMVANLVSAIEPLIMLVMGVAVGAMVAAIIMPMYNLASQF